MRKLSHPARTVLVIGEYRQTVTVVRSLSRAGFRVTLGCAEQDSPTRFSRHVSAVWMYDWTMPQHFCDQLESYLRRNPHDFVFTLGESPLRRLIRMSPRLEAMTTWVNPERSTIARCFYKTALYDLTPTLGIPTMPWLRFTEREDWVARARQMRFPVVVKRVDSSAFVHGRKALVLRRPVELDAFLDTVAADPAPRSLVLQKYQRGVRHNCHVAFADGTLVAYFQQKVLATDEPDDTGVGTAGESVAPSAALRAHCQRLGAALGYTGIGCIQFIVDESNGGHSFLEFNARMDSTAALPYSLGYDFPLLAIELAEFRRGLRSAPPSVDRRYATGRRYHWLLGDLLALSEEARSARLARGDWLARAARMAWLAATSRHLTFEWRDPMPTLHMFWQELGRRVVRRIPWPRLSTRPG